MSRRVCKLAGFVALVLAGVPASARGAAVTFDFEGQPIGTQTPFTVTSAGLGATFAGPAGTDPDAFEISYNSSSGPFGPPYRTLTGAFLTVGNAFGATGSPLAVTFDAPVTAVSLLFALDGPAGATLTLTTDAGGTASASGAVSGGYRYPEGGLAFSGAPFTSLSLHSTALDFQIDDLSATTAAAVPEPATPALLGVGLGAAALARRRRPR